jgi:hypothetical protein
MKLGSISTTLHKQLFRPQIPKAQKDSQVIHQCLFALLGSFRVKATCKTLVKLTTDYSGHERSRRLEEHRPGISKRKTSKLWHDYWD